MKIDIRYTTVAKTVVKQEIRSFSKKKCFFVQTSAKYYLNSYFIILLRNFCNMFLGHLLFFTKNQVCFYYNLPLHLLSYSMYCTHNYHLKIFLFKKHTCELSFHDMFMNCFPESDAY